MSARSSIYRLLLITLIAWSGLLLFTYFVEPQSTLALVIFFLIASVALTSIFAIIAFGIGRVLSARVYHTTIRRAIRQGALLSLAIMLNLILRILHSGSVFTAMMIIGAALVLEVLALAKK
jgi:hypothetical protein